MGNAAPPVEAWAVYASLKDEGDLPLVGLVPGARRRDPAVAESEPPEPGDDLLSFRFGGGVSELSRKLSNEVPAVDDRGHLVVRASIAEPLLHFAAYVWVCEGAILEHRIRPVTPETDRVGGAVLVDVGDGGVATVVHAFYDKFEVKIIEEKDVENPNSDEESENEVVIVKGKKATKGHIHPAGLDQDHTAFQKLLSLVIVEGSQVEDIPSPTGVGVLGPGGKADQDRVLVPGTLDEEGVYINVTLEATSVKPALERRLHAPSDLPEVDVDRGAPKLVAKVVPELYPDHPSEEVVGFIVGAYSCARVGQDPMEVRVAKLELEHELGRDYPVLGVVEGGVRVHPVVDGEPVYSGRAYGAGEGDLCGVGSLVVVGAYHLVFVIDYNSGVLNGVCGSPVNDILGLKAIPLEPAVLTELLPQVPDLALLG